MDNIDNIGTMTEVQVKRLKDELIALKKAVAALSKSMEEMRTALLGSEFKEDGWIDRIRMLEIKVLKLENLRWVITGGAAVAGVIGGLLARLVVNLVS